MSTPTVRDETPVQVRIPADLDTPDRIVAGLTARQVALLAAVAVPLFGLWHRLQARVPVLDLVLFSAPIAAITLAVALGRRDGLSLDRWLSAAVRHSLGARRLAPTAAAGRVPAWAPADTGTGWGPGVLRLPAQAIDPDGVITTGPASAVVLVAASTVSAGLHTPAEQASLLDAYGRWLNSLTGPVQVVVSSRRVDLGARALHLAEQAHQLPHPALAWAAIEHAEHLLDLSEDSDRLARTITIACTATTTGAPSRPARGGPARSSGPGTEAARRAERTAAALSALGSRCRILTGGQVSAVLAAAIDPFGPIESSWTRTPPGTPITARTRPGTGAPDPRQDTGTAPAGGDTDEDWGTDAGGDQAEGGTRGWAR